jgi:hypothetical protein
MYNIPLLEPAPSKVLNSLTQNDRKEIHQFRTGDIRNINHLSLLQVIPSVAKQIVEILDWYTGLTHRSIPE